MLSSIVPLFSAQSSRLILALLVTGLLACQPQKLSEQEYRRYLSDPRHGLVQGQTLGNALQFSAQYMPAVFLAFQEWKKSSMVYSPERLDSLTNLYAKQATFYVTIESENARTNLEALLTQDQSLPLAQALNHLDMDFPAGLTLHYEGESYAPSLCIRESAPGLQQKITFLVVFPLPIRPSMPGHCTLHWQDDFFAKAKTRFDFSLADLSSIPQIIP